jgi:hypothetical protein
MPRLLPLWAFEHTIPDSAAGDTLGIDAAQLLASDFLRSQGIEPADLDLKESRSERQKAGTDHTFEWQVPDFDAGRRRRSLHGDRARWRGAALRPYMHCRKLGCAPSASVRCCSRSSSFCRGV